MLENNCPEVLECLHKAIEKLSKESLVLTEEYNKAIELQEQSLLIQENVEAKQAELRAYAEKLLEWLAKYGCQLGCNINDPKCQAIKMRLLELAKKADMLQDLALKQSMETYKVMQEIKALEVLLAEEYANLVKCIHHKPHC